MTLAERLRRLRGDRSQREIALALRVTRSAYSMYEIGERTPDDTLLVRMADYFRVTVDYLLGRTGETTLQETGAPYDSDSLASRWPSLSPDRRRKAADMERDAKAQGIEMHLGRGLTNEEFDSLLRGVTAFAAFMAKQRTE